MIRRAALLSIIAWLSLWPAIGGAQDRPVADSAPVDISADTLDIDQEKNVAYWRGDPVAVQGDRVLKANVFRVHYENGEARKLVADGRVRFRTPTQNVTGKLAVYDLASRVITVTGDVTLVDEAGVLRGPKLTVNVETGAAHMESAGDDGRVRGRFFPNRDTQTLASQG